MDLVNELQISAEQDDVLTVLRKTMRVASKLNRQDITDWLQAEQCGYPENQSVPDYRLIRVVCAFYANGVVPGGRERTMNQTIPSAAVDSPVRVVYPMSSVLKMIADLDKGPGICQPAVEALDRVFRIQDNFDPMFHSQITLRVRLNDLAVRAIPERVKDKVLEWALALERAGVTGEGMSFTAKEKEIAHSFTFNISGSHIEQLNNLGTNLKGDR